MATQIQSAFWGMVINNYDETDLALVQQGYPDFIRQIVYTLEAGTEKKTPHIQAYVRLFRQQRMSYMRKLFPGASDFKALLSDEYNLNAQRYAQKLDETAQSPAVISNNPFPDPVVELTDIIETLVTEFTGSDLRDCRDKDMMYHIETEERQRVSKKPSLAKFYVSATYKNIKKEFWRSLVTYVVEKSEHTHTHTHTDEKFSLAEDIENAGDDSTEVGEGEESETEGSQTDSEGDQDSSCEETERPSESGSVSSGSQDD